MTTGTRLDSSSAAAVNLRREQRGIHTTLLKHSWLASCCGVGSGYASGVWVLLRLLGIERERSELPVVMGRKEWGTGELTLGNAAEKSRETTEIRFHR